MKYNIWDSTIKGLYYNFNKTGINLEILKENLGIKKTGDVDYKERYEILKNTEPW